MQGCILVTPLDSNYSEVFGDFLKSEAIKKLLMSSYVKVQAICLSLLLELCRLLS